MSWPGLTTPHVWVCCSGGVKGDMLVPHLNMMEFFRLRQQQRERGGASFGMGWLVKDTLQAFCTSMDDRILPAHLPKHR